MNTPLVSAVITTHQRPQELLRAIESVNGELYPNIECIVVEDGHQLERDVLKSCQHSCRLIQHDGLESSGVAGARNLGLEHAGGKYIICLDDDDVVEQHRIATLVEQAESGAYDICYGLTRKHHPVNQDQFYLIPTCPESAGEITFADMLVCMPHVNATLLRTDAIRSVGGYDRATPHFDEWSPLLKILDRGGRGFFSTEVVADWFVHHQGLTGEVRREHSLQHWIMNLLEHVAQEVSSANRQRMEHVLSLVQGSSVATYDEYVELVRGSILPE